MEAEGKVLGIGESASLGAGTITDLRLLANGGLAIGHVQARYHELTLRGKVFMASTAVSGVAPGTAVGTTAAFTLYNPSGSNVLVVPLWATMGYISGTLGAGTVFFVGNHNPQAAAVSGTAISVVRTQLGIASVAAQGNIGLALTTSTLPATPTILRPFCSLGAHLATTAVQPWQIVEDLGGQFALAANTALSFEAVAAAGTAPLVAFGVAWTEVPIPT